MSTLERLNKALNDHQIYRERTANQIQADKLAVEANEDLLVQIDTLIAMIRVSLASAENVTAINAALTPGLDTSTAPAAPPL